MTSRSKKAPTLADIEAAADSGSGPIDPERATLLLTPEPAETVDDPPAKKRRGRPKGSRNRKKVEPEPETPTVDPEQERQRLAAAIAGTVQMATALYVRGREDRKHWTWTEAELQQWGELWAGPLQPYMGAIGAGAPWVMALIGSGQLLMSRRRPTLPETAAVPAETGDARA